MVKRMMFGTTTSPVMLLVLLSLLVQSSMTANYFLITFHGSLPDGVRNVLRYSMDKGTLLGPIVKNADNLTELRGIAWNAPMKQLFFLNAHKDKNMVETMQRSVPQNYLHSPFLTSLPLL
jgi:hypothetical protein